MNRCKNMLVHEVQLGPGNSNLPVAIAWLIIKLQDSRNMIDYKLFISNNESKRKKKTNMDSSFEISIVFIRIIFLESYYICFQFLKPCPFNIYIYIYKKPWLCLHPSLHMTFWSFFFHTQWRDSNKRREKLKNVYKTQWRYSNKRRES